jgi:N-methylhydantoinase B
LVRKSNVTVATTPVDPVTTEVISSRVREIAATMEHVLYHSGYSTILRESKDGSAGLTDADGRVVIVGGGLQYHALPYQRAVQSVLEVYPRERLRPGDSFVVNDPYRGGNPHVPDFVAITPGFFDGVLIGFGVSIAHKTDVGGLVPGSSGAGSREIFHDGMLIPPVRFQTSEGINEIVEAVIRSNSRTPDVVLGDIRGQVGCTRIGVERLGNLCAEYGRETVTAVMHDILVRTGRRLRAELAAWPDGTAEAEGFLDHDGVVIDRPVRIHARLTKRGDRLTIDFSDSSPQTQGPVNANATTVESCSLLAVLAAIDPTIPVNSGLRDAVDFVLPPGLVVSPKHPATMNHYVPTCHISYNCVLSALGKLNPSRAIAPAGLGGGAIAVGYRTSRTGKPTVQYELMTTALGGTTRGDGAQIVMGMTHITPGTPVEVLESEYALTVRQYNLWADSAGAGRQRGGFGYVREYELLDDCVLTVRGANQQYAAPGLDGGQSPRLSRTTLNPGTASERAVGILETNRLVKGDVIRFEKTGGSGLGSPFERPIEQVLADVRDGYVSPDAANDVYGVTIDRATLEVDGAATRRRRGGD